MGRNICQRKHVYLESGRRFTIFEECVLNVFRAFEHRRLLWSVEDGVPDSLPGLVDEDIFVVPFCQWKLKLMKLLKKIMSLCDQN